MTDGLITGAALAAALILGWLWWQARRTIKDLRSEVRQCRHDLQVRIDKAEQVREGALRTVEDALLLLDSASRIVFANPSAESLLGPNLIDRPLVSVINQPDLDLLIQDAAMVRGEVVERRIEYERRIFNARAAAYKADDTAFEVLTLRDVTEIQRLERARREMVSNISHELSTPITTIGLLAETLFDSAMKEKPKRIRKMADDIRREVDTLVQLVQEMRDLSLIESGQMPVRMTPTDLRQIVEASVDPLRTLAGSKHQTITLTVPDHLMVLADDLQAQRALKNLVHNAIKFTPERGIIQVTATVADDEAIVAVRDNGPGIPADDLPRIFERFYQVDKARRNGTGLGLAIVRHIVMAHGGRVWAESVENQGATFYLTLPLADSPY